MSDHQKIWYEMEIRGIIPSENVFPYFSVMLF